MKYVYLLATLVLVSNVTLAQKEGNVWHFGLGAALDFNSGTSVPTTPSAIMTFEGSASIADANGNLLFYSNGGGRDPILSGQSSGKIWNRNHEVMYDMGNTEGGGFSAAQSSVFIPKPGTPNHYYLFTMEELEFDVGGAVPGQPQGRGLSYFEIDGSLNGGLGGVSAYNGIIYAPTYEGLCAIRHSNGSDYWILVHRSDGSGLAIFSVTAAGVNLYAFQPVPSGSAAVIKASPDGRWISTGSLSGQNLIRFDPGVGLLGVQYVLGSVGARSAEFSSTSQRLFVLKGNDELVYYELNSPDIPASETPVATVPSDGIINAQMQLGPDGEIYFVQTSFLDQIVYLSSIVCLNATPFVNLKKHAFPYADGLFFFGLPNFDNAIFKKDADPPLSINLGDQLSLCGPDTLVLNTGIYDALYQWSNGETTQTLSVSEPGIYAVTVTAAGCGTAIDSVEIQQVDLLTINAGADSSICAGQAFQLNASGNGNFLWSPDSLVSNPGIGNPNFIGTESASLVLRIETQGCRIQDTLNITVNENPVASAFPADTTIQAGASVLLNGVGNGTASWSPENGLSCINCLSPLATPEDSTLYIFTLQNDAGCTDSAQVWVRVIPPDCMPEIPNAFTPNGDGANDVFQPVGASIDAFVLQIYNRWGQLVFSGNTPWDGRGNGLVEAVSDVYVYRLTIQLCGKSLPFDGELNLLR